MVRSLPQVFGGMTEAHGLNSKIMYMKKFLTSLLIILTIASCNNNPKEIKRISGVIEDSDSAIAKITLITSVQEEVASKRGGNHGHVPPPPAINYDYDNDGVPDSTDKCPYDPGSILNYGCKIIVVPPSPPVTSSTEVSLKMPPVMIQGGIGSCSAFAEGYYMLSAERYYRTGSTFYNNSINVFSPEFLYNITKASVDCSSGSSIIKVLDTLVKTGDCLYASMPYTGTECSTIPNASQYTEAANFKISGYSKILNSDSLAIKSMINQHHPMVVAILADDSFQHATAGFIWKAFSGYGNLAHFICICGYDDSKHAYKVVNSWGTAWGDAGYSWIDYTFFSTGGKVGTYLYVIN